MKYRNSFFLSILSGLMLGISWPTYGFYFLIFIAFTPLIHLIESNKNENIFKLTFFSFVTFMVWNIITTHWLYYATLTGMLFAIIVNSILMSLIVLASLSIWKKLSYKLSIIFFISLIPNPFFIVYQYISYWNYINFLFFWNYKKYDPHQII